MGILSFDEEYKRKNIIAIIKTSYWKETHKDISKEVFNIEKGLLNNRDIKLPDLLNE